MKKRKASSKKQMAIIEDKKLRGEWAESVFQARASERGIPVSKPWGDMQSYDFVIGHPGSFWAIQVKCTISELEVGFKCSACSHNKPYAPGSFDFLAAYVIPEDAWYIIPEEKVRGMKSVSLATNCNKSKYERYREAWHLLEGAKREKKIDRIQACAERFPASWFWAAAGRTEDLFGRLGAIAGKHQA
jgi:hypothetical protein